MQNSGKSPRFLEKRKFYGRLEEGCVGATKNDEGRVEFVKKIGIWERDRGVRLPLNPYTTEARITQLLSIEPFSGIV